MELKNAKNFLRAGLFAFLFMSAVIGLMADPARVVSKQENIPVNGNMMTRIFLDITPNDENNQADAFIELYGTNLIMSIQEFSDLVQVGDVIDYTPRPHMPKDGRFTVISLGTITNLNGRNIYEIFVNELGDSVSARDFPAARRAYETQQSNGR